MQSGLEQEIGWFECFGLAQASAKDVPQMAVGLRLVLLLRARRTRSDSTFPSQSGHFSNSESSGAASKSSRALGLAACPCPRCLSTALEFDGPVFETRVYRPG